jgi:serine/threonine protein kinase
MKGSSRMGGEGDQYNSSGVMTETIGHYKLLDRVGSGGLGDLFRARDTRVGRTVALKVLPPDIAGDRVRRSTFLGDAARLTALNHPAIASVYEAGEDQGTLFLAAEFVPGDTLNRAIAGRGMNARRAIDYGIQMADALAEAHAVGIVHGHLTTANVMVTPKGSIKILEFGLAPWTRSGRTSEKRDDIFALGTVLFEIVAGRPFGDEFSPAEQRAISREVPPELEDIIGRLLTAAPERAYASPAAVAADLRAAAEAVDQRTEVKPPPPPLPARRPNRSRSGIVILAAIAVLAVIVWMVVRR